MCSFCKITLDCLILIISLYTYARMHICCHRWHRWTRNSIQNRIHTSYVYMRCLYIPAYRSSRLLRILQQTFPESYWRKRNMQWNALDANINKSNLRSRDDDEKRKDSRTVAARSIVVGWEFKGALYAPDKWFNNPKTITTAQMSPIIRAPGRKRCAMTGVKL